MGLRFPAAESEARPPPDLMAAIRESLLRGPDLPAWRAARVSEMESVASSLLPFSVWLHRLQPRHAEHLPRIHTAMAGAMAEAMGWPHVC